MKDSSNVPSRQVNRLQDSGICPFPLVPGTKRPACKTKPLQDPEHPDLPPDQFDGFGTAIMCGEASGNLEALDFDDKGSCFRVWKRLVNAHHPGLLKRLPVIRTPSGGYHVLYRCDFVEGNKELAKRPDGEGKGKILIETRGEGGYVATVGTPGYKHIAGPEIADVPTITPEERDLLWKISRGFDEMPEKETTSPRTSLTKSGNRVGDRFNASEHTFQELLAPHGWTWMFNDGKRDYWRRPGKSEGGHSATTGGVSEDGNELFNVFSSNADPFEAGKNYTKFGVFTYLNHGRDAWSAAARELNDSEERPLEEAFPGYNILELEALEDEVLTYAIDNVLCQKHHGMVLGPSKGMKTSISADLAVSVATGSPFLGMVPVNHTMQVGFMSGESGLPTLRRNILRIYEAKGRPEGAERMITCPKLPKVTVPKQLCYLERWVDNYGIEFLILDPMYLMINAEGSENVIAMGDKLDGVGQICQDRGVTLLINHHFTQNIRAGEVGTFQNASWAGSEQWMRQWLVVNRMQPYEVGSGKHQMRLVTGGSPGHSAGWDLVIDEEKWEIQATEIGEAERKEKIDQQRKLEELAEQMKDRNTVEQILRAAEKPMSRDGVAKASGLHKRKVLPILEWLHKEGFVRQTKPGKHFRYEIRK